MRLASKADEEFIVDILSRAFESNPSVNAVIKQDKRREDRIKELCRFSFRTVLRRNGVYISSNEKGVALCYKYNSKKNSFQDYVDQLSLVFRSIGLNRVIEISKRDSYIKEQRPSSGEFLYFWFIGTDPLYRDGRGARELRDFIFSESTKLSLPIYLETSVEKNMAVYKSLGFEVYHTWQNGKNQPPLYFMRRPVTN